MDLDWIAIIDRVSIAVCAVDRRHRVVVANAAASELFACADGLEQTPEGRLVATDPQFRVHLRAAPKAFTIARPSGSASLCVTASLSWDVIILTIVDPGIPTKFEHAVRALYRLSVAEAGVARGIVGGQTLSAIARARGVSRTTVKTQLERILVKTGVSRQSELARLLARAASVIP